jgi:hypothetical protein
MLRRRGHNSEISAKHAFVFYLIEDESVCPHFCFAKQTRALSLWYTHECQSVVFWLGYQECKHALSSTLFYMARVAI